MDLDGQPRTPAEMVRVRFPDLDPQSGAGAARRWTRLIRLAEVVQEQQLAQARGEKSPTAVIAEARGVAPATVRGWLHQATREGFLCRSSYDSANRMVARRVRVLRKARGWSAKQLAEQCAELGAPWLTGDVLYLLEGARSRRINVDDLVALAKVFDTSAEQLLNATWCTVCGDAPPAGFTCNDCGAAT